MRFNVGVKSHGAVLINTDEPSVVKGMDILSQEQAIRPAVVSEPPIAPIAVCSVQRLRDHAAGDNASAIMGQKDTPTKRRLLRPYSHLGKACSTFS